MKFLRGVVVCAMAVGFVASGCGKESALQGKVVDGQGKAMAGLKVTATKLEPVQGYEQFETTTGPDGTFRFDRLFRSSAYLLKPLSEKWSTEDGLTVESGSRGKTKLLPSAMVIRFTVSAEGVIRDSKTGLEWYVGPDTQTSWDQASDWVTGLSAAGGGWRMPAQTELAMLLVTGAGGRYLSRAFKTTGRFVWSGEVSGPSSPSGFNFGGGAEVWGGRGFSGERAFAVRAGR